MSTILRPSADTDPTRPIGGVCGLHNFHYFILAPKMLKLIPGWLWKKKMANMHAHERKLVTPSWPIFKNEVVDLSEVPTDLSHLGFIPCHIHHQQRVGGNVRVRVSWREAGEGVQRLSAQELEWIYQVLYNRFIWTDSQSFDSDPTTYLPHHINISASAPQERPVSSFYVPRVIEGVLKLSDDRPYGANWNEI